MGGGTEKKKGTLAYDYEHDGEALIDSLKLGTDDALKLRKAYQQGGGNIEAESFADDIGLSSDAAAKLKARMEKDMAGSLPAPPAAPDLADALLLKRNYAQAQARRPAQGLASTFSGTPKTKVGA